MCTKVDLRSDASIELTMNHLFPRLSCRQSRVIPDYLVMKHIKDLFLNPWGLKIILRGAVRDCWRVRLLGCKFCFVIC